MVKFSDNCDIPTEDIINVYRKAINPYRNKFADKQFEIITLPNGDYGIKAKLITDAGSDSQILTREPIVIGIDSTDVESCSPYIFPDRLNFPFEKFPHINYPHDSLPPTLCLTREKFEDWYVEHTFEDFIQLIINWFNDASKGNLIKTKKGDFYEPFRPHKPSQIFFKVPYEDALLEKTSVKTSLYFSIFKLKDEDASCFWGDVTKKDFENCYGVGILFVKPSQEILDKWFIKYPKTVKDLLSFINDNGFIWEKEELIQLLNNKKIKPKIILLQFAFIRPTLVLGKNTKVDYLTFSIKTKDILSLNEEGEVNEVHVMNLLEPKFSNYLSDTPKEIVNKNILILGCGAIGSKLIYHFYRSGICNLTIVDNDDLLPHNICRHAVTSNSFWSKKVNVIKRELIKIYPKVPLPLTIVDEDIIDWLPNQELIQFDLIIDTTASAAVMRCIDEIRERIDVPIIQFALSEGGNIGHVYVNQDEKVLMADFYMNLLNEAIEDDDLSDWLNKEKDNSLDYIRIGEGCHSNTMILSDDIISTHVSLASQLIKNINEIKGNKAYFSFIGHTFKGEVFSDLFSISNMVAIQCCNASDWEIRIPSILLEKIRLNSKHSLPNETGGYLMGCIERKYKRIYILHTYVPKISYRKKDKLCLSTKGWKENHQFVSQRTAGNLIYIGDWHSHPKGSLDMSMTDYLTNYTVLVDEIEDKFGVCLITNLKETKAYLLNSSIKIKIKEMQYIS